MRIAIIAVTDRGISQALGLAGKLGDSALVYAPQGRCHDEKVINFSSLSQLISGIFNHYDGFVFIMAAGIAVRMIAPYIQDKRFDPAVVVMDDCAEHAISLLSGHIGGANDLARRIGELTGAEPVITTATDVGRRIAADVLAVKLGLVVEPIEHLKLVNAAIANGGYTAFFIDPAVAEDSTYVE
jgi:cobalt-precorrin 5A hydrolase